jgi:hypothetical protein
VLLQCTIKYNLVVNLQQICFVPSNVLDSVQNGQVQKGSFFLAWTVRQSPTTNFIQNSKYTNIQRKKTRLKEIDSKVES